MTVEQHIADILAVTGYLGRRFGVEKVHLKADSWGSFFGLQAAARAPELFHSYIGMGQVTHEISSEQQASGFVLKQCRARGDHHMVRRLERAPVAGEVPLPRRYEALRDAAMHRLVVGTTRDMRALGDHRGLPAIVGVTGTHPRREGGSVARPAVL